MTGNDQPILVTGLPRSGTTWLARQLARGPMTALPGREPMNPRAKQFALGGTLDAWTRLRVETMTQAQQRTLRRVYRGREPRVYSRYGIRQWRAALPTTRLVVKDPFALLSLPAVMALTNATPVVLFRHPGALLASYRRMRWTPAVREIAACLDREPPEAADPVGLMAWFWSSCYEVALADTASSPTVRFVDHAELTRGGEPALRELMAGCGIAADALLPDKLGVVGSRPKVRASTGSTPTLHNFDRTTTDVVDGWRATLSSDEVQRIDEETAETWARLRGRT